MCALHQTISSQIFHLRRGVEYWDPTYFLQMNCFQDPFFYSSNRRHHMSKHKVVDKKRKLDNGRASRVASNDNFFKVRSERAIETDKDKENVATNQKRKHDCSEVSVAIEMTPIRKQRSFSVETNGRKTERLTAHIKYSYKLTKQSVGKYNEKINIRRKLFQMFHGNIDFYVVGSTLTGTATQFSDLDMCLVLRKISEETALMNAKSILDQLKTYIHPHFENIRLINAKVPLLKFTDAESGIQIDLNVSNTVGIRNTQLLYCYMQMDHRVAPLVIFAKLWARQKGINDAHKKSFSSYNVSLLMIHFLQHACKPPVLPCLQKLLPNHFSPTSDVKTLNLHLELPDYRSQNEQTLGDLFLDFLFYYGFTFDYDEAVISVRTGATIPKSVAARNGNCSWSYICVEEPLTLLNTAQAIYDKRAFDLILKTFQHSYIYDKFHQNLL